MEKSIEQKEHIRQRYKGINKDLITIIPAKEQVNIFDDKNSKRVAVYARVSTGDPRQTSSYELQRNYYEDLVKSKPNWTLVGIYADEGISGTSLKNRDAFNRMIEDCKLGLIDLIVVKNIARFARNTVDCLKTIRDLAGQKTPVGVYFETERIYTSSVDHEMGLTFQAAMAQEERYSAISALEEPVRYIKNISLTIRASSGLIIKFLFVSKSYPNKAGVRTIPALKRISIDPFMATLFP